MLSTCRNLLHMLPVLNVRQRQQVSGTRAREMQWTPDRLTSKTCSVECAWQDGLLTRCPVIQGPVRTCNTTVPVCSC